MCVSVSNVYNTNIAFMYYYRLCVYACVSVCACVRACVRERDRERQVARQRETLYCSLSLFVC